MKEASKLSSYLEKNSPEEKISIYVQGSWGRGMSAVMFCWHVLMREEVGKIKGTAKWKGLPQGYAESF